MSVGYIHVQRTSWGDVLTEWIVVWRRKTSREVLSLGARCRWCNRWRGGSESQEREDGPSCPSAAAAFCWRFSSVVPIQFDGLREFIIQLHLCLLWGIKRRNIFGVGQHETNRFDKILFFSFQATTTYLFEGVTCNSLECLFYVNGFFGTGLKVGNVVLTLTPSLGPFGGYLCVRRGRDSWWADFRKDALFNNIKKKLVIKPAIFI